MSNQTYRTIVVVYPSNIYFITLEGDSLTIKKTSTNSLGPTFNINVMVSSQWPLPLIYRQRQINNALSEASQKVAIIHSGDILPGSYPLTFLKNQYPNNEVTIQPINTFFT